MPEKGDRIELLSMDDPDALPAGATGTVTLVLNNPMPIGQQVCVDWDPPNEHRSLMLCHGDRYKVVNGQ